MPEPVDQPDQAPPQAPPLPRAEVRQRRRWPSAIWLLPVVAVLVGLSLVLHDWLNTGPLVTIRFNSAEGLAVGKTQVRYKDVVIGQVENIALGPQGEFVLVKARIRKDAAYLANQESRFWVVRPRLGLGGVSGLGTLLSGAYIGVDAGRTQDQPRTEFVGLELPPAVTNDRRGKRFVIHANTLGSLDIGSPVYFRKVQVGRLASYQLEQGGERVALEVFIDAPNDRLVTQDTRFWNASGVDLTLNSEGLKLNTQSLATLIAGGIGFDRVAGVGSSEAAQADSVFELYPDQTTAFDEIGGPSYAVRMEFEQSLRGLSPDAPIEFQGIGLGKVTQIGLRYDSQRRRFISVVDGQIQPQRLDLERYRERLARAAASSDEGQPEGTPASAQATPPASPAQASPDQLRPAFLRRLVEDGLRAQLKTANLLTGQMYVSLTFVPRAPKATLDVSRRPLLLPTAQGDFDQLQGRLSNIINSLEQVPFGDIGKELKATLASVNQFAADAGAQLTPEARKTLQQAQRTLQSADHTLQGLGNTAGDQAPLVQNANQTLQEINRAARSLRVLSDYLQTHPESLLRGRGEDGATSTPDARLPMPQQPATTPTSP
ncbi:MAG: MlaD family protein [Comamonas sp.]